MEGDQREEAEAHLVLQDAILLLAGSVEDIHDTDDAIDLHLLAIPMELHDWQEYSKNSYQEFISEMIYKKGGRKGRQGELGQ